MVEHRVTQVRADPGTLLTPALASSSFHPVNPHPSRCSPALFLIARLPPRLIDVVMSNCIHSSVFKIYILTQYNSTSLNRYLVRTYDLGGGIPVGGDGELC